MFNSDSIEIGVVVTSRICEYALDMITIKTKKIYQMHA